jgi:squalene-hopene/tetraprenyl-beta-curcumene cyclase
MGTKTDIDGTALRVALATAVDALLSHRSAEGHWEGWLSSSALSTAVAALALARAGGPRGAGGDDCAGIVGRALAWLTAHQNADGGWGDTVASHSNLSTTVLCWCALSAGEPAGGDARGAAVERAGEYVARHCGSLSPRDIAAAVWARYGNDRTFSAPILTMAALAGKLGPEPACWKHVVQLPFELGALSHATLRRLRLPVVSYALPALIAIGQVRHARRPTRNPVARLLRNLARDKTLAKLRDIQPESGGYLEAAPLTSFVLMSISAMHAIGAPCGRGAGPSKPAEEVIARAVAFLRETVRPDGAWPIDTNLATWVTTLSVNALPDDALDGPERAGLRDWLLACQYRREHPYTQAAPGGWAWTNLSGGVPDADDTAGALCALARLAPNDSRSIAAAAAGCRWLLDLQNRDGGLPTFCRGWGSLPFDRSCHDLTAHALLAWHNWLADAGPELGPRVRAGIERAVRFLIRSQGPQGQWTPLWFGHQDAPGESNPVYGTARVLLALVHMWQGPAGRGDLAEPIRRGAEFLLDCQGPDGGFGGDAKVQPSIEETALALDALANLMSATDAPSAPPATTMPPERLRAAVAAATSWLIARTRGGRDFPAAPIGLYFAKLWYFERLYPLIFTVSALASARKALGA